MTLQHYYDHTPISSDVHKAECCWQPGTVKGCFNAVLGPTHAMLLARFADVCHWPHAGHQDRSGTLQQSTRMSPGTAPNRPASTGGSGCTPMVAGMTASRSSRGRWASCRTSLAAELVHECGGTLHISTPGQCGVDGAMWGDTDIVRCMSPAGPAAAAAGCLTRQPRTRSALHMHCASHQQTPCKCRVHIATTGQEDGT